MGMTTTETKRPLGGPYALGRTPEEYERLRAQARMWDATTGRLLAEVGLGPGASCLDAGCGPGETMRAMAGRVGPAGRVLGIDADASLGDMALEMLHVAGYRQCAFHAQDLTNSDPIPGAPFDLVYARLLLFHLPQRVDVLARLWEAVAPGGHLLVQDFDLRGISSLPQLDSVAEGLRLVTAAFGALSADVSAGARLPRLFVQAGVGVPDATDVAGHLMPLAAASAQLEQVVRSVLPTAVAHGITTVDQAEALLAAMDRDVRQFPDLPTLMPLLISAWKRKRQP
jgi:ubiquinone/menaquinone biosynthesis C-methylase UbiE